MALHLALLLAVVMASIAAPASSSCTFVRNPGFESTSPGQNQTSPYWKVKSPATSSYAFFKNDNSGQDEHTPYGSYAVGLSPTHCDQVILSQKVCPGSQVPLQLTYEYNPFEYFAFSSTQPNLTLTVSYAGTVVDQVHPKMPKQGSRSKKWFKRTTDFKTAVGSGALQFQWGVADCSQPILQTATLGLDQISYVVTP